ERAADARFVHAAAAGGDVRTARAELDGPAGFEVRRGQARGDADRALDGCDLRFGGGCQRAVAGGVAPLVGERGVDADPHAPRVLVLVLAHEQAAGARARLPVDVAAIVAGAALAQAVEFTAAAELVRDGVAAHGRTRRRARYGDARGIDKHLDGRFDVARLAE